MPDLILTTFVLLILIGINALYVLAEFSTVSSRKARLSQLAEEGNPLASHVLHIVDNPAKLDTYVATSQVGITISSLVLGYFGQARLSSYLIPLLQRFGDFTEATALSISASVVLVSLTVVQVLFGELIPKNMGIQEPEKFALFTYQPLKWSGWAMKPIINLLNGSGILLMRLLRIEPSVEHGHIHSPEEISILIEESGKGGAISHEEYRLLTNTLRMRDAMVKHVMIPRALMLAASNHLTITKITTMVSKSPYSRIPIYQDTIDNIIGIVHLRDLFCWKNTNGEGLYEGLDQVLRPVLYVPETMQVKDVFQLLQKKQYQVAIILDEFGGTSGMVTLEDLIEEIFGDLRDEFDQERPAIQVTSESELLIQGNTPITELNNLLDLHLPTKEVDTLNGLLAISLGHIPVLGEEIEINGYTFTIHKMRGRAVASVVMQADKAIIAAFRENM
ncbi:hemolysin family protein [bacterium]|nr:hemolysin family protein [bacterium]MCB2180385.1 hemolysin family protein [bacterium]